MNKYVIGLILGITILNLVDLGFIIKILIILGSLFIHVYIHWILENIKLSKFRRINELINIISPSLINLLISIICFRFNSKYFEYTAIVNLAICIINLIPIYPFDGRGVLDLVVDCIKLPEIKDKLYKVVDRGVKGVLLVTGILQIILYANNFSVLLLYMMVKLIKKREEAA